MSKTSTAPSNPMHHIWRLVEENAWRVVLRRQTKLWRKNFGDGPHGGKRKALAAAKAWRDELMSQISGVEYELWRRERIQPTNTSGITGVYLTCTADGSLLNFQASWTDINGKRYCRSFSIKRYGKKQAKQLACQARQEGIAQLEQQLRAGCISIPRSARAAVKTKAKKQVKNQKTNKNQRLIGIARAKIAKSPAK